MLSVEVVRRKKNPDLKCSGSDVSTDVRRTMRMGKLAVELLKSQMNEKHIIEQKTLRKNVSEHIPIRCVGAFKQHSDLKCNGYDVSIDL